MVIPIKKKRVKQLKRKNLKGIHIIIFVFTILFLILTSIAMILYSGGSWIDITAIGFNFKTNFFSDLSRRSTFLGASNLSSSIPFTIAIFLVGASLICLFVLFLRNFLFQKEFKKISIAIFVLGIMCALVYISIGFTPFDIFPGTHSILIIISFCYLIILMVVYTARIFLYPEYPNFYGWLFVVFFILSCGYLVVILSQDFTEFIRYIKLRAIFQKIIVYTGIVILLTQTVGSLRFQKVIASYEK